MEQIRRNTSEFSTVATLLHDYSEHRNRKKLVLLYALKPSEPIENRILINKLKDDAATLYNMAYESVLQCLEDRGQKLYRDSRSPLYYFKSSASSDWLKCPFEFTGILRKKVFPLRVVK